MKFVKEKPLPGENKLKFKVVIDYSLLNSITEGFKICQPKISEIATFILKIFDRDR